MENVLNKKFANVCDWFRDNKLSIHFKITFFSEENKTY